MHYFSAEKKIILSFMYKNIVKSEQFVTANI